MNKIKQIIKNHTSGRGTKMLMKIVEERHGKRSTLFTSQLPVQLWYEIIGDQTLSDAILDRIVHDAHRVELQGESLRRKRKMEEQKV